MYLTSFHKLIFYVLWKGFCRLIAFLFVAKVLKQREKCHVETFFLTKNRKNWIKENVCSPLIAVTPLAEGLKGF